MEAITGMKRGFYHYVYGVDTSSSACVAAYITDCINQHSSD
jgi:Na+-translocating ferredoxin:NAD+ oxidoreductase RNF subunit RnfB